MTIDYAEARRSFAVAVPDAYNFGYDTIDRWATGPAKLALHWVGPGGLELQEHTKATTAPYKYPRLIEFVPDLPKTISGKIRRVELRARADA